MGRKSSHRNSFCQMFGTMHPENGEWESAADQGFRLRGHLDVRDLLPAEVP